MNYAPDLAFPGAADRVAAFTRLAVDRGVRRLVLLSGRNEEGAQRAEQAVQRSGAEWTIVRSSIFSQNFSEGFLLESVLGGELAFPAGNVAEPFVDTDDIADIAVAALTEDRHVGQLYEVTGPRLMTFADAADDIAAATGRALRLRSDHDRSVRGRAAGGRSPARLRDRPDRAVRADPRRPQCVADRRRATRPRPRATRLPGLRA